MLTIEPEVGDDPGPSDIKLLGGDAGADGAGTLSVGHPAALGTDLTEATASYILETPTSAAVADDYALGLWFLDPAAGPGRRLNFRPCQRAGCMRAGSWTRMDR